MRDRKRRKLTKAELRALGATPGLMARHEKQAEMYRDQPKGA